MRFLYFFICVWLYQSLSIANATAKIPVTAISLYAPSGSISTERGRIKVRATVQPSDATNRAIQWTLQGDAGIATIFCDGTVVANGTGNGKVTVVATAADSSGITSTVDITITSQPMLPKIFELNDRLGRGVNIGNALEAPNEGEWGVTIQERYFKLIADKGFNSVRIPINWSTSNRADLTPPYTISSQLFDRVDWVIQNSLKNKLSVVICMHHYDELYNNPLQQKDRFLAIWRQISDHYKNYTDSLYFEVLNEPEVNINAALWNSMFPEVLTVVRQTNPTRAIIVGPTNYNDYAKLDSLVLPNDDNLIVTVHYYLPSEFTSQGAHWMPGYDEFLGTAWDNTESQRKQIYDAFSTVKNYADSCKRPVYNGEFGTLQTGDRYSRHLWTNYASRTMDSLKFNWGYFDFCYLFGLYDDTTRTWRNFLTDALLTDSLYPATKPVIGPTTYTKDFTKGFSPWAVYAAAPASATVAIENGTCHVSIPNPGNSIYDVKLVCPSLNFVNGKSYLISFDMYGSGPGKITGMASQGTSPWTHYSFMDNVFDYSTTIQHVAFNFTMIKPSDANGMVVLSLGQGASNVYLTNFKVEEITFTAAEVIVSGKDNVASIDKNNGSLQMTATVYPIHAANKNVVWSVENITGKATIMNDGLLQATGTTQDNGLVKVIATSADNPDVSGSAIVSVTGQVTDVEQKHVTSDAVFPNPVSGGYFYYQRSPDMQFPSFTINMTDMLGRCIFSRVCKADLVTVETSGITNGIYLLSVLDGSKESTYKVIIAH